MTAPSAPIILPGGYMIPAPVPRPSADEPMDLSDPTLLGAALAASGVDPATSVQVVQRVQQVVAKATTEAVATVLHAVQMAQWLRAQAIGATIGAMPWSPADPLGHARTTVARVAADPSLVPVPMPGETVAPPPSPNGAGR